MGRSFERLPKKIFEDSVYYLDTDAAAEFDYGFPKRNCETICHTKKDFGISQA